MVAFFGINLIFYANLAALPQGTLLKILHEI